MDKHESNYRKELEEIQCKINEETSKFYETLDDDGKKRMDIISEVSKILESGGAPFWLFVERPVEIDGVVEDRYVQYNWCPQDFDHYGELSKAGIEFKLNHMRSLLFGTFTLISNSLTSSGMEISWDNVFNLFYSELRRHSNFYAGGSNI